jgi:hypothetical protein
LDSAEGTIYLQSTHSQNSKYVFSSWRDDGQPHESVTRFIIVPFWIKSQQDKRIQLSHCFVSSATQVHLCFNILWYDDYKYKKKNPII